MARGFGEEREEGREGRGSSRRFGSFDAARERRKKGAPRYKRGAWEVPRMRFRRF